MLTACLLHNRTYHSGANGIPVTLVSGHIPDLSNLRVFGCPAYVHIPASQRRKMEDTAFQGILVGYSTDTYGYLIYNPSTRRVITTRHVGFDETFNGRLRDEGISSNQLSTQPPVEPVTESPTDFSIGSDDDEQPVPTRQVTRSATAPAPPIAVLVPPAASSPPSASTRPVASSQPDG